MTFIFEIMYLYINKQSIGLLLLVCRGQNITDGARWPVAHRTDRGALGPVQVMYIR